MKIYRSTFIFIWIFIISAYSKCYGQKIKENFIDTTDNAFDISTWMSQLYGFVPVVSLITEPAIGYGAAGGLMFVHKKKIDTLSGKMIPPSLSVLGGLYTENGTWGTVLFHSGIWKKDHIRYLGILGYADANLTYYRETPQSGNKEFGFNLKGAFLIQEFTFRLRESPILIGPRYSYFSSETSFTNERDSLPVEPRYLDLNIAALGLAAILDTRDNIFTPDKGSYSKGVLSYHHEYFGSDEEFGRFDLYWYGFTPAGKNFTLGLRADARLTWGDTPFYAKPYIILRGVPFMRYQNDRVLVIETEQRWDITRRWSLVGFAGAGKAFPDLETFPDMNWGYSLGGGFRYKLSRLFNIYSGMDVARGPEQWAFYIQFGHYWNGL